MGLLGTGLTHHHSRRTRAFRKDWFWSRDTDAKVLRNDHQNSSHAGQKKFTKTRGRVMKKKKKTFLRPLKVETSPFLRPLKVETTPLKNLPSPSSLLLLM